MKVESIRIIQVIDDMADTSCIGEYTDQSDDWNICRCCGEYIQNCDNDPSHEIPSSGREYRFFKPYAGGEVAGTADYQKYGKQDYDRIEALSRGDYCFIGITAEARVSYPIDSNGNRRLESFTSSGLWGIESDSGKDYIKEVELEQLGDLASHLSQFGIAFNPNKTDLEIERVDI